MGNTVVNTNVLAINSHRNLKSVGGSQSKSSQRLSSGLRINSAADDAAGLAISEKMRAQIRGLDQASTNSQDGISLLQTAEGGLQEIDNMLQRVRELVTQAANDTNDYKSNDRQKIQDEINSLIEEIDSMQNRVEFNNKKLINGSAQDTAATTDRVKRELADYGSITATKPAASGGGNTKLKDAYINSGLDRLVTGGMNKISAVAASVAAIGTGGSNISAAKVTAAIKNAGNSDLTNINTLVQNIDKAMEALKGSEQGTPQADAYTELSDLKKGLLDYRKVFAEKLMLDQQLTPSAPGDARTLYLQVGANADQSIQVNIGSVNTKMLNIGDGAGGSNIDVRKEDGNMISAQLDTIDAALSYVTTQRSKIGATQNRLEYTINSLNISSENLTAAESRIRDTDMAKEMMNLTKSNVLQQAATSMLAQANQAPQNVLQLLQG